MLNINDTRIRAGFLGSDDSLGKTGAFVIGALHVVAIFPPFDTLGGWEHVTVARHDRCPTWEEMCYVKELFWDPETLVWQYHPPLSQYNNFHPFALHLWRKIGFEFPLPPSIFAPRGNSHGQ
jgi:hypothetical protein